MPLPMKDDVFRWEYTLLTGDMFDDGRTPGAVTFGHTGVPYPPVVHAVRRPKAGPHGSGPWWFPQDLAVSGDLIGEVLRIARQFTLLPVVPASRLADGDDVEVVAVRHVVLPTYSVQHGPPSGSEAAANLRDTVRALIVEADHAGEDALTRCVSAIEVLRRAHPGEGEVRIRLVLLRFSDREMIEGPPVRRTHPAIIIDGRSERGRASSEQDEVEAVQGVYEGAIRSGRPDLVLLAGLRFGELLEERGDIQARGVFQRTREAAAIIIAPNSDYGAHHELAKGENHNIDPAAAAIAVASWEYSPEAALRFGAYLRLHGDTDGARVAFQFTFDSAHVQWAPMAAFNLGSLLDGQGDSAAAERYYQNAIDSGDAAIASMSAVVLGLVLLNRGEIDRAEKTLRLTTPGALLDFGYTCAENGDRSRAFQAYVQTVRSGHDEAAPEAALALGAMMSEIRRFEEAEKFYMYAVIAKNQVVASKAALGLGHVRVMSKDLAGAEAMFRRAVMSPDEATADMARKALGTLVVET